MLVSAPVIIMVLLLPLMMYVMNSSLALVQSGIVAVCSEIGECYVGISEVLTLIANGIMLEAK